MADFIQLIPRRKLGQRRIKSYSKCYGETSTRLNMEARTIRTDASQLFASNVDRLGLNMEARTGAYRLSDFG